MRLQCFPRALLIPMNRLTITQITEFAGGSLSSGDGAVAVDKVSTDSRTIKPGELFVALRGENFDGHNFVGAIATTGAAGAIVDSAWEGRVPENFALIRAKDTLLAYQELAANYRKQRKDEYERLRCSSSRPPLSSHQNTGKFQ